MTEEQEKQLNYLEDHYCIMYAVLGRTLMDELSVDGEAVLREGTRLYGVNRGMLHRKRHLEAGLKINMKNLFTCGGELPKDTRTFRESQRINAQERVSHTLTCPMADIWKQYDCMDIGRIYCEEFHASCYRSYAYGYTKVNIAKTLTQEGDEYCSFHVILRPQDLPENLRGNCFEDYDSEYRKPEQIYFKTPEAKEGYRSLWLRLYYFILKAAVLMQGSTGKAAIRKGLNKLADTVAIAFASEKPDLKFLEENYPLCFDMEKERMWTEYNDYEAKELIETEFKTPLLQLLHMKES